MQQDYRLPRTARNEVYKLTESVSLNPAEFRWSDEREQSFYSEVLLTTIAHGPTGYRFTFTASQVPNVGTMIGARWTPAGPSGNNTANATSRAGQLALCAQWLRIVKEEHDAVDLWAAVADESQLLGGHVVGSSADERFTPAERDLLRLRLDEIKGYLIEHGGPTPEHVTHINVTFNYVADASERLTKRDWKVAFIGSLLPLLLGLGLTKEVIHGTLALAAKYVLPLLGQLHFPMP